jgi:hypothetical protein
MNLARQPIKLFVLFLFLARVRFNFVPIELFTVVIVW